MEQKSYLLKRKKVMILMKAWLFKINAGIYRMRLGDVGSPCKISPFATFRGSTSKIDIGPNTIIFGKAYFNCDRNGGRIRLGTRCEVHDYARIMTYGGSICMGDDCSVNPYSLLYGHGGLNIGSMVRIAAHVVIIPGRHITERIDVPIVQQGVLGQGITIKDNVWIGSGAKILGNVTVESGVVIGANAVLNRNAPENAVVAGVPAKIIGTRGGDSVLLNT